MTLIYCTRTDCINAVKIVDQKEYAVCIKAELILGKCVCPNKPAACGDYKAKKEAS